MYTYSVFEGSTDQDGQHLVANIPTITQMKGSTESYGDRLLMKFNAAAPVHVCITDNISIPYPAPNYNQSCNVYESTAAETDNEQFLYFTNFMNRPGVGNVMSTTRIYITVWAESQNTDGEGFDFNITLLPSAYISPDQELSFYFTPKNLFGNDEYVHVAFDVRSMTNQELLYTTISVGPECNSTSCRNNPPSEFYSQSISSYLDIQNRFPSDSASKVKSHDKGVQLLYNTWAVGNKQEQDTLYLMVHYRFKNNINAKKSKSPMAYTIKFVKNFSPSNVLNYQTSTSVTKTASGSEPNTMDYYTSVLPYSPSEVTIFPCKGKPALLIDAMSINSDPTIGDYQEMLTADWGKPITRRFVNDPRQNLNMFFTVFDEALYDYEQKDFTEDRSTMMYEVFVGSLSEVTTPGNNGQITVTEFSPSGKGKLKIRFAPAREPDQTADVS